ncbi:hypothetical protein M9458_032203, partial [Cirrhinus mrigala]
TIPDSPPVSAILGGSLTLPCLVSLSRTPSLATSQMELSFIKQRDRDLGGPELYKGRASLPNYATSSADLTLRLDGLIHNDTGFYRCEVQHGLEDARDQAHVKVK